jgi:hypothetical protein
MVFEISVAMAIGYAAHKHPKVLEWIDKHPRFVFHFTPTSASWLNAVKGFFAKLTKKRCIGVVEEVVDGVFEFLEGSEHAALEASHQPARHGIAAFRSQIDTDRHGAATAGVVGSKSECAAGRVGPIVVAARFVINVATTHDEAH